MLREAEETFALDSMSYAEGAMQYLVVVSTSPDVLSVLRSTIPVVPDARAPTALESGCIVRLVMKASYCLGVGCGFLMGVSPSDPSSEWILSDAPCQHGGTGSVRMNGITLKQLSNQWYLNSSVPAGRPVSVTPLGDAGTLTLRPDPTTASVAGDLETLNRSGAVAFNLCRTTRAGKVELLMFDTHLCEFQWLASAGVLGSKSHVEVCRVTLLRCRAGRVVL
jgi:hypothetical protein